MTTRPPSESEPSEGAPRTLGELLYANRKPAAESEWVSLVQAVSTGDQRALRSLYDRAQRIVFTLMMRIVNDRAAAEELTVDVFHDIWRRASSYDAETGPVLGWILNQARSRALDRLRFESRKKRVAPFPQASAPTEGVREPDEAVDLQSQRHLLESALAVLTPPEREAVESAFFGELTYSEVAQRLNEPLGTVKTRIRNALRKLRGALAQVLRS